MQMRSNAESAAFYRAGEVEKSKTNMKLQSLLSTQNSLILREYALHCKFIEVLKVAFLLAFSNDYFKTYLANFFLDRNPNNTIFVLGLSNLKKNQHLCFELIQ